MNSGILELGILEFGILEFGILEFWNSDDVNELGIPTTCLCRNDAVIYYGGDEMASWQIQDMQDA